MVFSSSVFLSIFLPAVLLLYYGLSFFHKGKDRITVRNFILLLASLLFYSWGEPVYVLIMVFSTVFDYTNGRLISYFQKKDNKTGSKVILILSIVINLGILCFFKYKNTLISDINHLFDLDIINNELPLPIGISFYTFQTLSYTIDVYRKEVKAQKNILAFATYVAMFPQLIAGPIVKYRDVESQLLNRVETSKKASEGMERFILGLGKKVLLANNFGEIWNSISNTSLNTEISMGLAWFGAVCFTLQIYYDFSGYSDMAIGLGKIFGFDYPENFLHPYESRSISDFWRRWHVSLGSWFREYVYIPLGGNRKGVVRHIFNMLVVWALTGLWHGAPHNYILWGIYYFILLILEKYVLKKILDKAPSFICHLYSMFFVVIGWMIFANEDLAQCFNYLKAMFSFRYLSDGAFYEFRTHIILLIIGVIGATTIPQKLISGIASSPKGKTLVRVLSLLLLVLSIVLIISGTYNPFLYFRF